MTPTTEEFASPQETQRALECLFYLQKNPELQEGLYNKYPRLKETFSTWPLRKEPTEIFLRFFESTVLTPEQGIETEESLRNTVNPKQLKNLVDKFNKEIAEAKTGQLKVKKISKEYIKNLVESVKKTNEPPSETQAQAPTPEEQMGRTIPLGGVRGGAQTFPQQASPLPGVVAAAPRGKGFVPIPPERVEEVAAEGKNPAPPIREAQPSTPASQEEEAVPIPPERVEEVAAAVIQHPVVEKAQVFQILMVYAAEQPEKSAKELLPDAVRVAEAVTVMGVPAEMIPETKSFSSLATTGFQKVVAGAMDGVVPAPIREVVVNKMLLRPLETVVNHPETLPQNVLGEMVNRWGENFVNSSWFNKLRVDTNHMMGDALGAIKVQRKFTIFVSDLADKVFKNPLDNKAVSLDKNSLVLDQGVLSHNKDVVIKINNAFSQDNNVLIEDKRVPTHEKNILTTITKLLGAGKHGRVVDKKTSSSGTAATGAGGDKSAPATEKKAVPADTGILVLDKSELSKKDNLATKIGGALSQRKKIIILDKKATTLRPTVSMISYNVITYIETYRVIVTHGGSTGNISGYNSVVLGYGRQLLQKGVNSLIKKGASAIAKKAAAKLAANVAIKAGLTAIAGAATGGLGAVALAALDIAKGLINKGLSIFKSLLGMGNSGRPEDNALLVVGLGIVLVFFLPLFPLVGLSIFNQSMIDTSISTGTGGGEGNAPGINCQTTPNDPLCKFTPCVGDCRWPASGYITQGPNTVVNCSVPTTHAHASAIDIANFSGGPVYTPKTGTVLEVYSGCIDNSGALGDTCGGSAGYAGYGNHVVLQTDDGYTLIFGHLESAIGVHAGQHVTAGAQLGWMDQTGNSSGTHLHFGVLSGGSVLDFVPTGDPALSPDAINGCVLNTQGCTKNCPTTPVEAGT